MGNGTVAIEPPVKVAGHDPRGAAQIVADNEWYFVAMRYSAAAQRIEGYLQEVNNCTKPVSLAGRNGTGPARS